ncbi:cytochrome-c peroxidase [Rhodoflexus caldus]|uniref:cytochrome-c peroxidase n=1 Tax=Rhodoflexus caldus TaxID=2891236 RepID=UPI00202A383F|nr:cytochrome c peroxidase [Rhodoflexus caldus]
MCEHRICAVLITDISAAPDAGYFFDMYKRGLLAVALLSWLWACTQSVRQPTPYVFAAPLPLGDTVPQPPHNRATVEGVALGKMLFFDKRLSANQQLSCASCHQVEKSFSDTAALTSRGVSGRPLLRHAQALINLAWSENLFWDGGVRNLESLTFSPLRHPDEMGADLQELITRLQALPEYRRAFRAAFGTDSITAALISRALAQYQRTLIAANSRYDRYRRGEIQFNSLELEGMAVFEQHCARCHTPPLFTDGKFHRNGLPLPAAIDSAGVLLGRQRITLQPSDFGKYKTPTLRNIMLTAPYMHDGSLPDMAAVMAHYSNLPDSVAQANGLPDGRFRHANQRTLTAFLQTLTDSSLMVH